METERHQEWKAEAKEHLRRKGDTMLADVLDVCKVSLIEDAPPTVSSEPSSSPTARTELFSYRMEVRCPSDRLESLEDNEAEAKDRLDHAFRSTSAPYSVHFTSIEFLPLEEEGNQE